MKSMKESGYVDGYTDESTGDIGIEIYGRDVVLLNAPEVRLSPDTPLLTKAQDVAGAINELFQSGTGGGDDIYITSYTDTSLAVTVISDRTAETPEITVYAFTFTLKEYKTITKSSTSKGTSTRTWIKNIITSVANGGGEVIWTLTPNTEGKIIAVYDINGNEILGGITSGDGVITDTPEGVALGYALAYNKEQENYTEKLIEAYEDGVSDESTIGVDDEETVVDTTDMKGSGVVAKLKDQSNPYHTFLYYYGGYIVLGSDGINGVIWESYAYVTADGTYVERDKPTSHPILGENYDFIGDVRNADGTPVETDGITYN